MIRSVLLYGSRARGDQRASSDVDIMLISSSGNIGRAFDQVGITAHVYPLEWLKIQSKGGALFLLHLVREAVPIFDPLGDLQTLVEEFEYKVSYEGDIDLAARIIAATIGIECRLFSNVLRRRYFWALRTMVMAAAAERREEVFAAGALERFSRINGLGDHIARRDVAAFDECAEFGRQMLELIIGSRSKMLLQNSGQNLRILFDMGGMATATAGEIIYSL